LANNGEGLNLTYAVKDGIICHNGENFERELEPNKTKNDLDKIKNRICKPSSYEGCIVRLADKIAYLGRDIEDAIIANLIKLENIPEDIRNKLGNKNGEIINTLVIDVIDSSKDNESIGFSADMHLLMKSLIDFNYKYIYKNPIIEDYKKMGQNIIEKLFEYLLMLYDTLGLDYDRYSACKLPIDRSFGNYLKKMNDFYFKSNATPCIIVGDYIAGMTDEYALDCIKQITIPAPINFSR
jgi:dGTPase